MDAHFTREGLNGVVIELLPDTEEESLLLALWVGYDANLVTASVMRTADGDICRIRLVTSD